MIHKALAAIAFIAVTAINPALGADAFVPAGSTINIAATATTASAQIRTGPTSNYVRVYNSGTVPVFVACGASGILAVATTSMPVAANGVEIIGCNQQYVAAVTTTTATVYFTAGSLGK